MGDEFGSWGPPYSEWGGNPIFEADGSDGYKDGQGYENCEFFSGPPEENRGERLLHVLCQGHHTAQPHFVADAAGLHWRFVELLHTAPAKEPTQCITVQCQEMRLLSHTSLLDRKGTMTVPAQRSVTVWACTNLIGYHRVDSWVQFWLDLLALPVF